MGQYYLAVNPHAKTYVDPFGRLDVPKDLPFYMYPGAKLGAQLFCNNLFLRAVESLLRPGGDWYKGSVVWAGDYADDEPGLQIVDENGDNGQPANLYKLCMQSAFAEQLVDLTPVDSHYRYMLNHDTHEFIDLKKAPEDMHPLPLLTAEGNGRGGGDWYGEGGFDGELVGTWARKKISIENDKPSRGEFTELMTDLNYVGGWDRVGHFILLSRLLRNNRAFLKVVTEEVEEGEMTKDAKAGKRSDVAVLDWAAKDLDEGVFRNILSFLILS